MNIWLNQYIPGNILSFHQGKIHIFGHILHNGTLFKHNSNKYIFQSKQIRVLVCVYYCRELKYRHWKKQLDYSNKAFVPLEKVKLVLLTSFFVSPAAVCPAVVWGTLTPALFVNGPVVAWPPAPPRSRVAMSPAGRGKKNSGVLIDSPPVITLFHAPQLLDASATERLVWTLAVDGDWRRQPGPDPSAVWRKLFIWFSV